MATFKNFLGKQQELDPEFKPITPAEAIAKFKAIADNAGYNNMTPEQYIASRGGINRSGYYGDSYGINSSDGVSLTDEEYDLTVGKGGEFRNAALAKKIFEKTGKVPTWWNTATPGYTATVGNGAVGAGTNMGTGMGNGMGTGTGDADRAERVSAYNILFTEFNKYGLGSLVSDIKDYLVNSTFDPSEFSIKLQNTQAYQNRFSANKDRIAKGLSALNPAEYIALEDQYQNVMRNYGLPASYYAKDSTGKQSGFDQLIANDVDSLELEDRIMTAQQRVMNSNPEVLASLKSFYPDITNGDILAYTLDPKNAITEIKRKVTAAEIGGAATQAGLKTGMARAEELGAAGVTKAVAQQGFETVASGAPRGGQLASIYGQDPYTQTTAETEVFGLTGKTEAAKQRKKVTGLEKATFGGQSGATSTALVRDRAGAY